VRAGRADCHGRRAADARPRAGSAYDLIIVDAYSSDAIPIHLATSEAMAIYKSKIAPDGIVTLHLSNRNLALDDVAVGIAAASGMKTWIYDDSAEEDDDDRFIYTSDVAIPANKADDLGALAASRSWKLTAPVASQRPWTDDYSNIVQALIKKLEWTSWNISRAESRRAYFIPGPLRCATRGRKQS
jgi:hypothetical protein